MTEPASPLPKYDTLQLRDQPELSPSSNPFNQYPLPLSPVKSIQKASALQTPAQRSAPMIRHSAVKAAFQENDIFAISPGMFPRSVRRMDYLDLFAETHRGAFQSPIKIASSPLVTRADSENRTLGINNNAADNNEDAKEELIPPDACVQPALSDVLSTSHMPDDVYETSNADNSEEDHPHLALLAYLAGVASVTGHLPEQILEDKSQEEEAAQGGVEDILTAAALAESMKEELFTETEDDVLSALPAEEADLINEALLFTESVSGNTNVSDFAAELARPQLDDRNDIQDPMQISESTNLSHSNEKESSPSPSISPFPIESQEAAENAPAPAIEDRAIADDDWESLISFSEVDETRELTMDTTALDSNEDMSVLENTGTRMIDGQGSEVVMTGEVTGCLDEAEGFGPSKILIFHDPSDPEGATSSRIHGRESLDNQVIFSIPSKKETTGSPPKRQIALDEQENVRPSH